MSNLCLVPEKSLREIVRDNATGNGSVARLTNSYLQRISDCDARIRAMVHIDSDGARQRASELDELIDRGGEPLPLHGVPVVIKEIFSVTGMPDSSGSRLPTPELFTGEGSFVAGLRTAGCVILGKSLSTEFALSHFNTSRPMPVNPVDEKIERATGGSSCGSAAAMAAGYCGFSIGSDTGGSVRAPAALCGLVGYKPTAGLWSMDGVFPLFEEFDTPGIFSASVHDVAYIYEQLSAVPIAVKDRHESLRIGVPEEFFQEDLDDTVAAAFATAKTKIAAAGHELVEIRLPSMEPVRNYFATVLPVELLGRLGHEKVRQNAELLDPLTQNRLEAVLGSTGVHVSGTALNNLRNETEKALRVAGLDCWISPTVPCVAPPQTKLLNQMDLLDWQAYASRNTRVINALGMAAITLPLQAQLPVGLQLGGLPETDTTLLAAAVQLEPLFTV
jgi:aspartyl-tRNA(Asn)/glutamyl-tRNA(Gln) amidotransferase subunit A